MFSRRHPYLFFSLVLSSIIAVAVISLSLLVFFASGSYDYLSSGPKVGIIELSGVITDSRDVISDLKKFRTDDSIRSIVLRVDSPGGAVAPSQEIYGEIRKTVKVKKVIASMGSVAASGGYYVASAAHGIIASHGTITGSIGVILGYTNFRQLLDRIGLVPVVIKSGEHKDIGSPVRPMTELEEKILQNLSDQIHGQFVRDIANAREMDIDRVKSVADGRIFTGEEFQKMGLVDRLGNLEDAVEWAGRLGGIDGEVSVVYAREKKNSVMEFFFGSTLDTVVKDFFNSRLYVETLYRP
jgi:protease IV